jgi:hypothetical protein
MTRSFSKLSSLFVLLFVAVFSLSSHAANRESRRVMPMSQASSFTTWLRGKELRSSCCMGTLRRR